MPRYVSDPRPYDLADAAAILKQRAQLAGAHRGFDGNQHHERDSLARVFRRHIRHPPERQLHALKIVVWNAPIARTLPARPEHIGTPVPRMANRVRAWLEAGRDVRIFTARAGVPEQIPPIESWCMRHFGRALPVTDRKDFGMVELWDDRCVQVIANTGLRADGAP